MPCAIVDKLVIIAGPAHKIMEQSNGTNGSPVPEMAINNQVCYNNFLECQPNQYQHIDNSQQPANNIGQHVIIYNNRHNQQHNQQQSGK